ncbi:hypothetical protein NM208_g1973 [Fusarium decemcellulare]|uniref:Uncharacterized protein n=1 Tax=Fusarium decemcellulare TaxID=57161 RepID=A0ACC1SUD0_9HYPO|nr:hypothetical protein NM208_g1973 [Fusarium decemcellulare]
MAPPLSQDDNASRAGGSLASSDDIPGFSQGRSHLVPEAVFGVPTRTFPYTSNQPEKNPAAVREACNIYGRALTKHSRSIAHNPTLQRAASLCTCVMLSLFEAVWSTSSVAYGMHLRAAQEMLALGPPEPGLGHEEVIFQLGQHVYCQTLFVMLATPQQYVEHAPTPVSWARIPSVENIGTAQVINRLMFDLFYLADVLARKSCNGNAEVIAVPDVGPEVEELWQEFQQQATRSGELIQWPTPSGTGYLDPFTAMVVAYFHAARVLRSVLGSQIGSSTVDASCDSILQSCYFLEGKNIGCAYLRMFFPLMLVAMHGSGGGQQAAAYGVLEQWLSNTAFKGRGQDCSQSCPIQHGIQDARVQFDSRRTPSSPKEATNPFHTKGQQISEHFDPPRRFLSISFQAGASVVSENAVMGVQLWLSCLTLVPKQQVSLAWDEAIHKPSAMMGRSDNRRNAGEN